MDFFKKLYGYLYFQSWRRGFWTPPDRKVLINDILQPMAQDPAFEKILFVGVQDYCAKYLQLLAHKQLCTMDSSPVARGYGAQWHITDVTKNLRRHISPDLRFDAIILNGVIGYGLDDHREAEDTLQICLQSLSGHGVMVLGLNLGHTGDVRFEDLKCLAQATPVLWPPLGVSQLKIPMPGFRNLSHSYYFYGASLKESLC